MKTKYDLVWNVFYHSVNADEICVSNVFKHSGFMADIDKAFKKCKTKEKFAEALQHSLMYYFWSKCEWEVLISPWVGGKGTKEIKVDVYWQIRNNWEIFVDYVWNSRNN